jgi:hypothetical protein
MEDLQRFGNTRHVIKIGIVMQQIAPMFYRNFSNQNGYRASDGDTRPSTVVMQQCRFFK